VITILELWFGGGGLKYSPGLYFLDKISFPTFPNMSPLIKKKENLVELGKNKSKDFFLFQSQPFPLACSEFSSCTGRSTLITSFTCVSEQVKEIQSIYPNR